MAYRRLYEKKRKGKKKEDIPQFSGLPQSKLPRTRTPMPYTYQENMLAIPSPSYYTTTRKRASRKDKSRKKKFPAGKNAYPLIIRNLAHDLDQLAHLQMRIGLQNQRRLAVVAACDRRRVTAQRRHRAQQTHCVCGSRAGRL